MELKAQMVKTSLEELKMHDKEDRTVQMTMTVFEEVWENDILPEIALLCEYELIPHHYSVPSLVFTDDRIGSMGEDWASPAACLNALDEYEAEIETEILSEAETPEEKTKEPEVKAEEPEVKTEEPEVKAEGPEEKTKEPEEKTKEPEVKAEEPEVKTEEPEVKTEEPEVKTEEPEVKTEEPEVKTEVADRSESRLLNWQWFSEIALLDNPGDMPKVVEHLNGKGLIRTKQDMLDTILLVLVTTQKINLKGASVIFDRFDTLS
jgi:hypothetical protein